MSLVFALEAIKFHRLKHEWTVRLLFLVALAFCAAPFFMPEGSRALTQLINHMNNLIMSPEPQNFAALRESLTPQLYSYLALILLCSLATLYISYLYAAVYFAERSGRSVRSGFASMLRNLPLLILTALAMLLLAIPSSFFFFIPLLVLAMIMLFFPLILMDMRMHKEASVRIGAALRASVMLSAGRKFAMFVSFVILNFIFVTIPDLLTRPFQQQIPSIELIKGFFAAVLCLARGRLIALYYYFFTTKLRDRSIQEYMQNDPQQIFEDVSGERRDERVGDE